MTTLLLLWMALGDIGQVKEEADLGKRSELALENADREVDVARRDYGSGELKGEREALDEIRESAEVSYDALEHARQNPRKSKYYKHAEQKLEALIRRLRTLRDDVDVEERGAVESLIQRLQEIHDRLLVAIMSKKK